MSTLSLRLLALCTHQLDALRDFYSALGLSFTEERHGQGLTYFAATLGDTVFELYPLSSDTAADSTTRLGFTVTNLETILNTLETHGIVPRTAPRQTACGQVAVVTDPDGRAVELVQREVEMRLASSPCEAPPGFWGEDLASM